ncbi:hypothetical protein FQA39_LY06251 [Lamprigera yunnana]|nr:hypothetical protein FQA39_LY06251 [Lamprigera yunnana]
MRVHYYCLLLSETINQSGKDDEGILGFMASDIVKEINLTKNQKCCYCNETPATIGCSNYICNRKFHLHCGYENNAVFNFEKFDALCNLHSKPSNVPAHIKRSLSDYHCLICLEEFSADTNISDVVWANCCKSNVVLHIDCLRQLALNAGYFTKCPGCNDKSQFIKTIKSWGVFVPERDASWELDGNAFSELLYVHDTCDNENCICPEGKNYSEESGKWKILLCKMCGSIGAHSGCTDFRRKFVCDVCSLNSVHSGSSNAKPSNSDQIKVVKEEYDKFVDVEGMDSPEEGCIKNDVNEQELEQHNEILLHDHTAKVDLAVNNMDYEAPSANINSTSNKRSFSQIENTEMNWENLEVCKKGRIDDVIVINNSNDIIENCEASDITEFLDIDNASPSCKVLLDDGNEVEFISYSKDVALSPNSNVSNFASNKENEVNSLVVQSWSLNNDGYQTYDKLQLRNILHLQEVQVLDNSLSAKPHNSKCTYWDCFNIYRCGRTGHDRISVYVYPLKKYVNMKGVPAASLVSKEFYMILESIINSKYYTANPQEACLFVPSIDTLNQDRVQANVTSRALQSLPYWRDGENHLFFNMISGTAPDFSTVIELNIGDAIIAGAGFNTHTFRLGFDISIPIFSPIAKLGVSRYNNNLRTWFVISSQISIDSYFLDELQDLQLHNSGLLILDACQVHNYTRRCEYGSHKQFSYPAILQKTTFCLVFRGERMSQLVLLEALAANCIPIIVMDGVVMPFSNVIDWKRAAVFIMEDYLNLLFEVLKKISKDRIKEMQKQVRFLYNKYFSSMKAIVETTLDIFQDRVYPHWGRTYDDWNIRPDELQRNPLHLPITAPRSQGFTAAILTYDRVESLFLLIEKLSKVPSMSKVIVIWNHQKKAPPPLSALPKILKPIKVIRTKANKLSNRFYPFEEIETEAILTIDDDIVMLTADELEFGYEVWREFPDRIVGFPSRTHIWDNVTLSWKYESEWTNEISMVLTGAAFHHKYWSYLYTTAMPAEVRDWVDEHMNCEDIAMNFLVANVTNKPPIKVAPRKKFKCPECVNNEMLSADMGHMIERSKCVDRFTKAFGRMPLKSVEFRADPVLYKDSFPEKLKRFNDIGSL